MKISKILLTTMLMLVGMMIYVPEVKAGISQLPNGARVTAFGTGISYQAPFYPEAEDKADQALPMARKKIEKALFPRRVVWEKKVNVSFTEIKDGSGNVIGIKCRKGQRGTIFGPVKAPLTPLD